MLHSSCCTVHAAQFMLHSSCCTVHAAQFMLHSACTRCVWLGACLPAFAVATRGARQVQHVLSKHDVPQASVGQVALAEDLLASYTAAYKAYGWLPEQFIDSLDLVRLSCLQGLWLAAAALH